MQNQDRERETRSATRHAAALVLGFGARALVRHALRWQQRSAVKALVRAESETSARQLISLGRKAAPIVQRHLFLLLGAAALLALAASARAARTQATRRPG